MKCSRCGKTISKMDHFFIPLKNRAGGLRYCIQCAREEKVITLV